MEKSWKGESCWYFAALHLMWDNLKKGKDVLIRCRNSRTGEIRGPPAEIKPVFAGLTTLKHIN